MPKANAKKTAWAHRRVERGTSPLKPRGARNESVAPATLPWKKKILFVGLALLAIALLIAIFVVREVKAPSAEYSHTQAQIGSQSINLAVANTDELRRKGLSGGGSLGMDEGMLFVFPQAEKQCMWMKDMSFALDIIWLDEDKKIVKIEENVTPETYPKNFCSDQPTSYVIELNSGIVNKLNLSAGQVLQF